MFSHKKISLFLVFLLLFGGCRNSSSPPDPAASNVETESREVGSAHKESGTIPVELTQTYEDPENGFRFDYPETWKLGFDMMGAKVLAHAPPVDEFAANFNVVLQAKDPDWASVTQEDYAAGLKAFFRDIKFLKFEKRTTAGREGLYAHLTATMGEDSRLEMKQYFFNNQEHMFILTFTDQVKNFADHAPIFEAILQSFQLSQ